jgi:hypothetical protein
MVLHQILNGEGEPHSLWLKALIYQLPERSLDMVRTVVEHTSTRTQTCDRADAKRSEEYREQVQRRFREARKPGTLGCASGSEFLSEQEGRPLKGRDFTIGAPHTN